MKTKNKISNAVNGKIICFDDLGLDCLHVFYDATTDELCAGSVFNGGVSRDYSIAYDHDFSIDENVQALHYHICKILQPIFKIIYPY